MNKAMTAGVAKELRHRMASIISDEKAYDVPAVCRRLGLADGSKEEAYGSKYKYAHHRLSEVPAADLMAIARSLVAESSDFALTEILLKLDEAAGPEVTSLTRRRIVKLFDGRALATAIEEMDLIRSVWPTAKIVAPIQGAGYTLEDDLVRHLINNPGDLTQQQLLETLGLLTCSRAQLFRFLEAVTSPEAQTPENQAELASGLDTLLRHDGYALSPAGWISGAPVYKMRPAPVGSPADEAISTALAGFDPTQVHGRWVAAMERRASDPPGAITLARTLMEDVCKWILDGAGETWAEADDLPVLYRKLAKVLRLAPDDHTEQVFKQILGSCQSVVEGLGALRNKLGDAHSSGPKRARPLPRHAELAVNLSGAMATFLVATWEARRQSAGE